MVDLAGWVSRLDAVVGLIGSRFGRSEPRARVRAYVRGLLAGLERKNGWTLAEHAGAVSPDGMQRLLRCADWDVDGVRDDVRGYVLDGLGDPDRDPDDADLGGGVFIADDTGFVKKGRRSAGVQRQYTGTTGKIDNCQLGVFLAYATGRGHALIDRELYLPTSWTDDPERCAAAGIPAETEFATKPELAVRMLERLHTVGRLSGWFTADEAFGQNPGLRGWLAEHRVPYVLATRNDDLLTCPDGHRVPAKVLTTLAGVAADGRVDPAAWERRSLGYGAHGERVYDWTAVALHPAGLPDGWGHWLLVRQQVEPTEGKTVPERAYYRCAGPATTPLRELIRVAGARWAIEECFQTAKNEAGLDHYQVRTFRAWHAHITLSMLALAWLAVTRAHEHHHDQAEQDRGEKGDPQPAVTATTATATTTSRSR